MLEAFSLDEIENVVFSMEKNKAHGPDGFPIEFYQRFWHVIKFSLKDLFDDLVVGNLDVSRLNYGIISLVPKTPDADIIQKFRPICLLNVSLIFLTKVGNNRLIELADEIIDEAQTAFIRGRYILDGVVILHEILNEVYRFNLPGIVFKVDFEKAYDKVDWNFLEKVMQQKGFSCDWIKCVMSFVKGGKVAVKVNDVVGPYFRTYQGVRQGDPLSPILFNLAVDALTVLVNDAKRQGLIKGMADHLVPGGLSFCNMQMTLFLC